jgi:hypothetical protein
MKSCNSILFAAFAIIGLCQTGNGQWVPPHSRFDVSPETQRQNAFYQQQQAEIAAQKLAAKEAAKQAEIDSLP